MADLVCPKCNKVVTREEAKAAGRRCPACRGGVLPAMTFGGGVGLGVFVSSYLFAIAYVWLHFFGPGRPGLWVAATAASATAQALLGLFSLVRGTQFGRIDGPAARLAAGRIGSGVGLLIGALIGALFVFQMLLPAIRHIP
jgi:hypothetical protein